MSITLAELLPKAESVEERGKTIVITVNGVQWSFPRNQYREKDIESSKTKNPKRSSRSKPSKRTDPTSR